MDSQDQVSPAENRYLQKSFRYFSINQELFCKTKQLVGLQPETSKILKMKVGSLRPSTNISAVLCGKKNKSRVPERKHK